MPRPPGLLLIQFCCRAIASHCANATWQKQIRWRACWCLACIWHPYPTYSPLVSMVLNFISCFFVQLNLRYYDSICCEQTGRIACWRCATSRSRWHAGHYLYRCSFDFELTFETNIRLDLQRDRQPTNSKTSCTSNTCAASLRYFQSIFCLFAFHCRLTMDFEIAWWGGWFVGIAIDWRTFDSDDSQHVYIFTYLFSVFKLLNNTLRKKVPFGWTVIKTNTISRDCFFKEKNFLKFSGDLNVTLGIPRLRELLMAGGSIHSIWNNSGYYFNI